MHYCHEIDKNVKLVAYFSLKYLMHQQKVELAIPGVKEPNMIELS